MRWIAFLLSLSMVLVGSPAHSQSKKSTKAPSSTEKATPAYPSDLKLRVRVGITADDISKAQFQQCLYRELRKIPEVVLVDDEREPNQYELHIVYVATHVSGQTTGYAASTYVDMPINMETIDVFLYTAEEPLKSAARKYISGASFFDDLHVLVGPTLNDLCRRIAANFDTSQIEERRQFAQKESKKP